MIKALASQQFVRFVLAGGTAAVVNFGSRIVYNNWFGFSTSVILAYITGMITAFILTRLLVFGPGTQSIHRSAAMFTLVNLVAAAQTWGISLLLADYALPAMGMKSFVHELAHGVGVVVPVFTSYLGHKHFSFR